MSGVESGGAAAHTPQMTARNDAMNITVNGETREIGASTSVDALLREIGLDPSKVAVERNLEIVPKSQYEATILRDGDRIYAVVKEIPSKEDCCII